MELEHVTHFAKELIDAVLYLLYLLQSEEWIIRGLIMSNVLHSKTKDFSLAICFFSDDKSLD